VTTPQRGAARGAAWASFRSLPTWARITCWATFPVAPLTCWAAAAPPGHRRRRAVIAVVGSVAFLAVLWAVTAPPEREAEVVADGALVPAGGDGDAGSEDRTTSTVPPTVTPTAAPSTAPTATAPTATAAPPSTAPPATAAPIAPSTAPSYASTWEQALATVVVASEGPRAGYDRGLFQHWTDDDGDGCDTRCEVLARERRTDLPGLAAGWWSAYDGYTTDDPGELDVDHVVALAEAWDSGASSWDPARRRAFANDLTTPGALVAVTAATNRSKSDRDPAEWQPPNRDAWCGFGTGWVRTKATWGLTADAAEVAALRNILRGCP
jgi:hypothetical protein